MTAKTFPLSLLAMLLAGPVWAQSLARVEENWEMHVLEPDSQIDAPQVTTCLLPFGSQSDILMQLDINHANSPSFQSGGLQLKILSEDRLLSDLRIAPEQTLSHSSEILRWTIVVDHWEGGFRMQIASGTSESFGAFGGPDKYVWVSYGDAGTSDLNSYSISNSLQNSGISYGKNRIGWLRLKSVRVFDFTGNSETITVNEDVGT